MALTLPCVCGSLDPSATFVLCCSVCGERAELDVKQELQQGIEKRDPRRIRIAIGAVALGLGMQADQLEVAWQLLANEGRRGLLDQLEDIRSTVAALSAAVVKAEERAQALEQQLIDGAESQSAVERNLRPQEILDIRHALERRLQDNLERRVEKVIEETAKRSSQALLASAAQVVSLQKELQATPQSAAHSSNGITNHMQPHSTPSACSASTGRQAALNVHAHNGSPIEDAIKQQFHEMDVDGDGQISKLEMAQFFVNTISQEDVDYMFGLLDKDKDGYLNFNEFVQWVMQSGTAAALDTRQTPGNSGGMLR